MSYEVFFLREAQADLEAAYAYISNHSPQGAAHWLDALESAIDVLERQPQQYALAPENELVSAPHSKLEF